MQNRTKFKKLNHPPYYLSLQNFNALASLNKHF